MKHEEEQEEEKTQKSSRSGFSHTQTHSTLATHLHDTVSSTLVAGIAAVKGSASAMHAMFIIMPPGRSLARSVTQRRGSRGEQAA